jgi:hypothetical protein
LLQILSRLCKLARLYHAGMSIEHQITLLLEQIESSVNPGASLKLRTVPKNGGQVYVEVHGVQDCTFPNDHLAAYLAGLYAGLNVNRAR